jgi:succinate dehydrogenase (ubiquinone) cytochrome b560 subunit
MVSGALGSSNSSFNNMDGLRHSSSIGQAKGYASSPLGALRQKMSPSGSRALHTSRPLSAPVANRPLSPHLPLKKPQLSATFSISHRIFGVALGAAIISIPLATKFSLMFGVWVKYILQWWEVTLPRQVCRLDNAAVDVVVITSYQQPCIFPE